MNIKKMLEAQKKLDEANLKKAGIEEYPIEEVKTAYRVELGELLQEWKQFKFWKLSKGEIDREKLLEEWADCCHFALSLENEEFQEVDAEEYKKDNFTAVPEIDIYQIIEICFGVLISTVVDTIALGLKLGFTLDELEQAYYRKNKINWDRVNSNY